MSLEHTFYRIREARANVTPEQHLWIAVLVRAIRDAAGECGTTDEQREARRWLTEPSNAWRRLICELADFPEASLCSWASQLPPLTHQHWSKRSSAQRGRSGHNAA